MRKILFLVSFLFVIYFFYASISFIKISAATYDETVHLSSGYSYLVTGRYLMNISDHPPLAEMIAAFPLKFMNLNSFTTHKFFLSLMPYHYGDLFLYNNIQDAEKILNTSRYFLLFLWGILFIIVFYWCENIFGKNIGLISVILFSINPIFISNVPLVTTDIAPSFFYFLSFLSGYLIFENKFKKLNEYHFIIFAAISSCLAMASKYSMFILPPFFVALLILNNLISNKFDFSKVLKLSVIYLIGSFLVLAFIFKWDITLYYDSLIETFKRLNKGRSSFIMGNYSIDGVWYYFPVAFIIKNPVIFVLLFLIGLFFVFKNWKKFIWVLFPFLVYFLASINSKVQIGIRHLMPIMPFAILIGAIGAKRIIDKYSKSIFIIVFIFIFSFFYIIKTHPFYLSYFSEIVGGTENGYEYLTDSNIDWGQDIKSLSNYLKKEGNPPIFFSYFGIVNPEYYKIDFVPIGFVTNVNFNFKKIDLCSFKKILFAISVTNLKATYYEDKKIFKWLEEKKPIYKAGYSIFLYDLTGDKESIKRLLYYLPDNYDRGEAEKCLLGKKL